MPSKFLILMGALFGALFFFTPAAHSTDWKDRQWLRLLHYNKTLTGYLSEADGKSFFLHPEGKKSPKEELDAFLRELAKPGKDGDENVRCLFPARHRWVKKNLGKFTEDVFCPKLEAFRKRVSGKSIFVVFSSYYLNNPGSSFGHTFIRIGKGDESSELLDTGINYGMMSKGAGPILYTVGGLSGWFPGTFTAIPYYYKVREYNDYESRDLWSYRLNFTQEELDFAVDHIWELGPTYFDYYFLTENCSQMMLAILEVARPTLELKKHLPYLYTIPSDTLKTLDKEGIIESVSYRPSANSLFHHQFRKLSPAEQKKILVFREKGTEVDVEGLSDQDKANLLDAAISWVDFKYAKEILKQEERAQAIKRPLLVKRSKVPVRSPEMDFSHMMKEAPHLGHGSQRLVLGVSQFDGKNYADLSWRFAFHDFLDYDLAYPPRTRLEVVKFDLQSDGNKVFLRDFSLLDILTLGPSSWKFKLGHWQTRHEKDMLSTEGVRGGYGYSYLGKYWAPYVLAHGEASYVSEELHKTKFAYGADLGLVLDFSHNLKFNSALELRAHPWNEGIWLNEVRLSDKNYGVGLYDRAWLIDGAQEFGGRMFFYF